ncbi:hypothetical protein Fmac_001163 [Flemingia macrophylla]|uniref:Uncharacterized protein n=1 Tax=Flemingia macrophylla TaxID=520843 RepID=A0ABD1NHX3_9FABA
MLAGSRLFTKEVLTAKNNYKASDQASFPSKPFLGFIFSWTCECQLQTKRCVALCVYFLSAKVRLRGMLSGSRAWKCTSSVSVNFQGELMEIYTYPK